MRSLLQALPRDPYPDAGHGLYRLFRGALAWAVQPFVASLHAPETVQDARLEAILRLAAPTAFGREHGLDRVLCRPVGERWAAYRDAVPIRRHDQLRPWLDRVVAGERGVLTAAPVRSFVETSGTTGAAKWLPVTDAWAQTYRAAQELWILGMLRDDEGLRHGSAFSIVSPAARTRSPAGLPVGANTGRMFLAQPWWLRLRAPVPYRAYLVGDPEVRAYTLLRFALAATVTAWTTANPSTLLLYCRRMAAWWDDLRADVAEGTLARGPAAALGPADRRRLLGFWPRRREIGAWPHPAQTWPLRRVACWKGGSASFFLDRLPAALGGVVPLREAGVNASEGYVALAADDDDPVLFLSGHGIELVSEDAGGTAIAPWDAEVGASYRVVLSTEAGLLRYDLGDIVEVTGFCGRVPRVRFLRKAGAVLNATGEKVTEDQVLAAARRAFPLAVGVSVSLGWSETPTQRLAVEGPPGEGAAGYDAELMRRNVEYADKRASGRLAPPVLHPVPAGTFAAWRAARIAAGAPEAQVKDPVVLSPERWDELLGAAGRPDAGGTT